MEVNPSPTNLTSIEVDSASIEFLFFYYYFFNKEKRTVFLLYILMWKKKVENVIRVKSYIYSTSSLTTSSTLVITWPLEIRLTVVLSNGRIMIIKIILRENVER